MQNTTALPGLKLRAVSCIVFHMDVPQHNFQEIYFPIKLDQRWFFGFFWREFWEEGTALGVFVTLKWDMRPD